MIGSLLKELAQALTRFVWYHVNRPFRPLPRPASQASPGAQTEPAAAPGGMPTSFADTAALAAIYREPINWPSHPDAVPPAELSISEIAPIWSTIPGGLKWIQYFAVYDEVFSQMRDRPLRILEIGVYLGASLKLWRRYFSHPETCVVGIDIQQACAQFQDSSNGIEVRIGSQADPAFLKSVVDEFGPFDLIVDDGSHQTAHQIISFNELFLTGLKESGIYFVEDTHTNFWPRWRDSERSFVDLCKDLIDLMHAHYPSAGPNFFFAASETGEKTEGVVVPQITPLIREIRFFDSIIVIHKTRRPYVPFTVTTAQE